MTRNTGLFPVPTRFGIDAMRPSRNEMETLARRASRGAGLSWGLAEDAGHVTRWLLEAGLPGPQMLIERLERLDGLALTELGPSSVAGASWISSSGLLCPIIVGALIADRPDLLRRAGGVSLQGVVCPVLIIPALVRAACHLNEWVSVQWQELQLSFDSNSVQSRGNLSAFHDKESSHLTCRIAQSGGSELPMPSERSWVSRDCHQRLQVMARRTLAPATDLSRQRGAG